MDMRSTSNPFGGFPVELNRLVKRCRDRGIDFAGMQSAPAVEMSLGEGGFDSAASRLAGDEEIQRLEGLIVAKPVPRVNNSKLRYFLDGAQQTLPIGRLGHVPIYLSLTVAGILQRDESGECALVPGTLRLQRCWIVPEGIDSEDSRYLCESLRGIGGTVVDPLKRHYQEPGLYRRAASDYIQIEKRALRATNDERAGLEEDLLEHWALTLSGGDGWIVVDGQLRLAVPNAVGLVKSFTYQYFTGAEATALYSLPPGHRSSAFVSANQYRQRTGDTRERTLWYLRFHNADGLDARHGLIRLEAAPDFVEPERIDELSAWLLAERAPRATADARWDSLIYPIHLLERMLKNRVAHETRSWPGARR
jgi:hypothetical protein